MVIHFDSYVAETVGVDAAVMLNNFMFWIKKNEANKKHFHDGYYWTYNSQEAFSKLFPFWSRRQIQRILSNLIDANYLLKGNYNEKGYDQTSWYALTEKAWLLIEPNRAMADTLNAPNGSMDCTESFNGLNQTVQPIPYNNTDTNTYIYNDLVSKEISKLYPGKSCKASRDKKLPTLLKKYGIDEIKRAVERYTKEVAGKDKQYILNESTFWNGRYIDYMDAEYSNAAEVKKQPNKKIINDDSILEDIYK